MKFIFLKKLPKKHIFQLKCVSTLESKVTFFLNLLKKVIQNPKNKTRYFL